MVLLPYEHFSCTFSPNHPVRKKISSGGKLGPDIKLQMLKEVTFMAKLLRLRPRQLETGQECANSAQRNHVTVIL